MTSTLTIGSLFAGIGGLELGLERAGVGHTVWQVERAPYCRAVLATHWPDATRYDDVCTVGAHNLAPVDVVCGGFPCQDVSEAGKRAGIQEGTRSGLWIEYARIVRELRPRYVVVENVTGLLSDGMGRVLGDLADLGYDAEWSVLSACAVGAPHARERVFVLAYAGGEGWDGLLRHRAGRSVHARAEWPTAPLDSRGGAAAWLRRAHRRVAAFLRDADGIPGRVDLVPPLQALGNAVVPQVAEVVGRLIVTREAERPTLERAA